MCEMYILAGEMTFMRY